MEDTLREMMHGQYEYLYGRLNPCFNGRYSQSYAKSKGLYHSVSVLILVLMEDTLRVVRFIPHQYVKDRLNPCFNGRYSQSYKSHGNVAKGWGLNPCFNGRYSQR